MERVDIDIIQEITEIEFTCPSCEEEVSIGYDEFCKEVGEICDWLYSKFVCPECGTELKIDSVKEA